MRSGCTEAALDPRFRGGDMAGGYARASTVRHSRAKPGPELAEGRESRAGAMDPRLGGLSSAAACWRFVAPTPRLRGRHFLACPSSPPRQGKSG
jgi:hypothetical protein